MPDTPERAARQAEWERNKYHSDPEYRKRAMDSVKNKVKPGDGDPRHGKMSTYNNHKCHCPLCRAAARQYAARRRNGSEAPQGTKAGKATQGGKAVGNRSVASPPKKNKS